MTDRHQAPAYPLRLPAELKYEVTKAAFACGRSFNAEVTARLRDSLTSTSPALPQAVQDAVTDEMEARGGTPEEALTRLVLLGQSKGGAVFQVTIQPGSKMEDITAVIEAARVVVPPDADVFMDRK